MLRYDTVEEMEVKPVLIEKGTTKLAMYGMSNLKDERLNRMMRLGKVNLARPEENTKEWFNLLVLHQVIKAIKIVSFMLIA